MLFDHRVVSESFNKARPIALDVLTKFFEYLFADHPSVMRLFEKTDMEVLKPKMVQGLVLIINNLEVPDQLRPFLKDLGAKHLEYNIKAEHHLWFRDAFLKSLEYFFGEDWTISLAVNWSGVFSFIAGIMQPSSAQPHIPFPSNIRKDNNIDGPHIVRGAVPASARLPIGIANELPFNIGNLAKNADFSDLSALSPVNISLPEELLNRIRDAANALVRKAIETELETAMERELKKYLDAGLGEFLKKSS